MASPDSSSSPKKVEDHTAFQLGDYTWKELHEDMERDHFAGTFGGMQQQTHSTAEQGANTGATIDAAAGADDREAAASEPARLALSQAFHKHATHDGKQTHSRLEGMTRTGGIRQWRRREEGSRGAAVEMHRSLSWLLRARRVRSPRCAAHNAAYHGLAGIRAGVNMAEFHKKRSPDEFYVRCAAQTQRKAQLPS